MAAANMTAAAGRINQSLMQAVLSFSGTNDISGMLNDDVFTNGPAASEKTKLSEERLLQHQSVTGTHKMIENLDTAQLKRNG